MSGAMTGTDWFALGFIICLLGIAVGLVLLLRGAEHAETPREDPDACRPPHYHTSGPVTPMSRQEAEDDARVMAHRCLRGTRGCYVEHSPFPTPRRG